MEEKPRKRHMGDATLAIPQKLMIDGVPVSVVYEQANINPTRFDRWSATLFEGGASVFDRRSDRVARRRRRG